MSPGVQGYSARSAKKEKEFFMAISIKKTVLMVILVLALLVALFGWTARMMVTHAASYQSAAHSSLVTDVYCPPPPRYC